LKIVCHWNQLNVPRKETIKTLVGAIFTRSISNKELTEFQRKHKKLNFSVENVLLLMNKFSNKIDIFGIFITTT
jgi:hypothetical protein